MARAQQAQISEKQPRWRRRADARPAEILDAALTVFVTKGFNSAKLDDVAKAAGISKGTLYLYFANKSDLFKELVRQTLLVTLLQSTDGPESSASSAEMVRRFIERMRELMSDERRTAIPKLVISEAGNFPELAKFYVAEVISPVRSRLMALIQRGVRSGEFRKVDPLITAKIIIAPFLLTAIWQHTFRDIDSVRFDVDQIAAQHTDILLAGLENPKASRPPKKGKRP